MASIKLDGCNVDSNAEIQTYKAAQEAQNSHEEEVSTGIYLQLEDDTKATE